MSAFFNPPRILEQVEPEMDIDSAFFQRSAKVVAKFLQTAVVIDDRAFLNSRDGPAPPVAPLSPPPTPMTTAPSANSAGTMTGATALETQELPSPSGADPATAAANEATETGEYPGAHGIDAEQVIDSFAQRGIVCSVLKRGEDEDLTVPGHRAQLLLRTADILIVDWQVHRSDRSDHTDGTEDTLGFLGSAVRVNFDSTPQQLRLIVIYTGATDLREVADKVKQFLESDPDTAPVQESDFVFRSGALRIVVLGKPSRYRALDQRTQQVESDSGLCSRAIQEVTMMTAGLVSNVVLDSLAEVRRATHGILSRFGNHLDAPFLAHRSLLTYPADGNSHLVPLIVSELGAILEDQVSQELLADDSISEWLATRSDPLPLLDQAPELDTEEKARQAVRDICLKGVEQHDNFSIPNQPNWIKNMQKQPANLETLTNLIAAATAEGTNEKLEALMSLRPSYSKSPPMLALGTLLSSLETVAEQESAEAAAEPRETYWLCLQPACDCYVRTRSPRRSFPLLRLEAVNEKFNLIAERADELIRLRWIAKPYKVEMFEFEADSRTRAVLAGSDDGAFYFQSSNNPNRFRWIGQLKFPQAQRVAQSLASEAGRVGLTESEWLRLNANKAK